MLFALRFDACFLLVFFVPILLFLYTTYNLMQQYGEKLIVFLLVSPSLPCVCCMQRKSPPNVTITPPTLDFKRRAMCLPSVEEFVVTNSAASGSLVIFSCSSDSPSFQPSYFHKQVLTEKLYSSTCTRRHEANASFSHSTVT